MYYSLSNNYFSDFVHIPYSIHLAWRRIHSLINWSSLGMFCSPPRNDNGGPEPWGDGRACVQESPLRAWHPFLAEPFLATWQREQSHKSPLRHRQRTWLSHQSALSSSRYSHLQNWLRPPSPLKILITDHISHFWRWRYLFPGRASKMQYVFWNLH